MEVWPSFGSIRRRIAAARRLFLFLNFDGTLAPIVGIPCLASLSQELRTTLAALAARRDVVCVIVSGRGVDDLQQRIGLPLICVGDHGLEIRGAGLEYTVREARELRFQLLVLCNELRTRLESFPGALIECKRLTASVHVRQVERSRSSALAALLHSAIEQHTAFRLTGGNDVFEILPKVQWNRGAAVRWILQQMGGDESDAICVGDGSIDEDVFKALDGGITIRVGFRELTPAQYWIEATEVSRFLCCVLEAVDELRRVPRPNSQEWRRTSAR